MYKRLLVPLDGSAQSEKVLPWVSMLAEINEAEVILLRVAEYPYSLYSMCNEYPPTDPELAKTVLNKKRAICREAKAYLERIASKIVTTGLKVTCEVCESPVVEAILAATDRLQIDLIVLATCGQSGGTQWGMGAIADQVLHEAPVPVILIQPTPRSFMPNPPLQHRIPLSL